LTINKAPSSVAAMILLFKNPHLAVVNFLLKLKVFGSKAIAFYSFSSTLELATIYDFNLSNS